MAKQGNPQEALIKVSKNAKNFKMIGSEFIMGESERPIIETKATDTTLIDTIVSTTSLSKKKWFETPYGILILGIVGSLIASLMVWIIFH